MRRRFVCRGRCVCTASLTATPLQRARGAGAARNPRARTRAGAGGTRVTARGGTRGARRLLTRRLQRAGLISALAGQARCFGRLRRGAHATVRRSRRPRGARRTHRCPHWRPPGRRGRGESARRKRRRPHLRALALRHGRRTRAGPAVYRRRARRGGGRADAPPAGACRAGRGCRSAELRARAGSPAHLRKRAGEPPGDAV